MLINNVFGSGETFPKKNLHRVLSDLQILLLLITAVASPAPDHAQLTKRVAAISLNRAWSRSWSWVLHDRRAIHQSCVCHPAAAVAAWATWRKSIIHNNICAKC